MVAAVRAFVAERNSRGIFGERDGFAVYDFDGAGTAGKTRGDSFRDARGWERAAADGGERDKSAVLAADRRVRAANGRAGDYEYVVQFARGSNREYANGCDSNIF